MTVGSKEYKYWDSWQAKRKTERQIPVAVCKFFTLESISGGSGLEDYMTNIITIQILMLMY